MGPVLVMLLGLLNALGACERLGPTTTLIPSSNDVGHTLSHGDGLSQVRLTKHDYSEAWNE